MKENVIIELLDNGLLFRRENWCEAVLYNEDANVGTDDEYTNIHKYVGKWFTDNLFDEDSDLSEETKRLYETTGKPTIGYKVKVEIEPITKIMSKG
ncbi:MAG: hypothetical protein J6X18_01210 [Bacteroidales bacterium]|nr:hypothetical protein [Bacteroidales bacterium]